MENLVLLLTNYGYFILFPLAVIEGPMVAIVAGFLSSLGFMNIFFAFAIIMTGDVVGDSGYYMIGRWGGNYFSRYFTKHAEKISKVKTYFETHQRKAIALSKLFHGIGITGLLAAGSLKIPYKRYITICFLTTAAQSVVLFIIGILFGHTYIQLGKYFDYFSAAMTIMGLAVIFVIAIKKLKLFSD